MILKKWNKLAKKEKEIFYTFEKNDFLREQDDLKKFNEYFEGQNIADLMVLRPPTPKKCRSSYNYFV